jgi:uncharacterized protein (DUF302 family)/uncharacterized membrane protein YidH (DUF202 family)
MVEAPIVEGKATLGDYLAAERTLLAWVRTGIALMGFGFVVARFGLFLTQLQALQHGAEIHSYGLSLWFGTGLILIGVVVICLSAWRHVRLVDELERGQAAHSRPVTPMILIAAVLALIGLAMAVYLITVRNSTGNDHTRNYREIPAMSAEAVNGFVSKLSNHSVDETVAKLKAMLAAKGITLFAFVDHGGEAAKVGMKMPPTKLLIFGNPKGGTPLMLAAPSIAIDLPLKVLVSQDAAGKVWISYNSAEYLQQRHGLPQDLVQNIAVVGELAAKAAE